MNPAEFEAYLHRQIPITAAMGAQVVATEPEVILRFPLAPNLNHHATAFGGSLATGLILTAWSAIAIRLQREAIDADLVIAKAETDFLLPVTDDFEVRQLPIEPELWTAFLHQMQRKGKARINVESTIGDQQQTQARFAGVFVAKARDISAKGRPAEP